MFNATKIRILVIAFFILTSFLVSSKTLPFVEPDYNGVTFLDRGSDVTSAKLSYNGPVVEDNGEDYLLILENSGYLGDYQASNDPYMENNYPVSITYFYAHTLNASEISGSYDVVIGYDSFKFEMLITPGEMSKYSFRGEAGFVMESNDKFSFALIKMEDFDAFRTGYNAWVNRPLNSDSPALISLRFYLHLGLIVSIAIFLIIDGQRIWWKVQLIQRRRLNKKLHGEEPVNEETSISKYMEQLPCCVQTARLHEQYCLCGRAIPMQLLAIYE